ncbi:MAG: hypothetical protein DWI12_04745 [Planctomycetota bacterium]|nr:MAG: hypothetical protein DWI12_04745 [Planctomycetota bacterium]
MPTSTATTKPAHPVITGSVVTKSEPSTAPTNSPRRVPKDEANDVTNDEVSIGITSPFPSVLGVECVVAARCGQRVHDRITFVCFINLTH